MIKRIRRLFDRAELVAWLSGKGKPPLSWALLSLASVALMLGGAVDLALVPATLPRVIGAILMVGVYLCVIVASLRSVNEVRRLAGKAIQGAETVTQGAKAAIRDANAAIDRAAEIGEAFKQREGDIEQLRQDIEQARREEAENAARLHSVRADFDRLTAERPPSPLDAGGWAAVFEWQAAQGKRITDRQLSKVLGYTVNTIKAERYKLRQRGRNDIPKYT